MSNTPQIEPIIGQKRLQALVAEMIKVARLRGEPQLGSMVVEMILMIGPSGTGKSSLGNYYAKDTGLPLIYVTAHPRMTTSTLAHAYAKVTQDAVENSAVGVRDRVCLFIDEAHALRDDVQEQLMRSCDTGIMLVDSGPRRELEEVRVAPAVIITATNQPGGLRQALRSRSVIWDIDPYSAEDIAEIVARESGRMGITITGHARNEIARLSRANPREAIHALRASARTAAAHADGSRITIEDVRRSAELLGTDTQTGLLIMESRVLQLMQANEYPLSMKMISLSVGLDQRYIYEIITHLVAKQFVSAVNSGYTLSTKGSAIIEAHQGIRSALLDDSIPRKGTGQKVDPIKADIPPGESSTAQQYAECNLGEQP